MRSYIPGTFKFVAGMPKSNSMFDLAFGGISGAIAMTTTVPIKYIKIVVPTQDANLAIKSGKYQGARAPSFAAAKS